MTITTLNLAITYDDKESAIVNFLFAIGIFNLLIIGDTSEVSDIVKLIYQNKSIPCKVLLNKGNRTSIISPMNPDDNIKVIYCRANMDTFSKALIREYNPPILLFNE
jgi:hypothetical protein